MPSQKKQAKWPWVIAQNNLTWWFSVFRIDSDGEVAAYLGYYATEVEAIYAIAQTQE